MSDASGRRRIGIQDLVASGVLSPPLRLVRTYRGQELDARVLADGGVQFRGEVYPSLSAAAVAAIQSTRPGGEPSAINGWQFWRYIDESGNASKVDDLRRRASGVDTDGSDRVSYDLGPP